MPANSFQNAICPDGKYAVPAGELHLLDEGDRNTSFDISVNPTTSWVEHDLSASGSGRVPKGTKALFGLMYITRTDVTGTLQVRDATSTETNLVRTWTATHSITASVFAWGMIIKATDGKFYIKERDSSNEIANFSFQLWGYFL